MASLIVLLILTGLHEAGASAVQCDANSKVCSPQKAEKTVSLVQKGVNIVQIPSESVHDKSSLVQIGTVEEPCAVGSWSAWGPCSNTCGDDGEQTRSRHVEPQGCAVALAPRECARIPCPVDCQWDEWGEWGACSKECRIDGGKTIRYRNHTQLAAHGGKECCGRANETKKCGDEPTDGELSPWGEWSACSKTCNTGTQSRGRSIQTHPKCGGHEVICNLNEVQNCFHEECTYDCAVGEWSEWGECPKECGGASQTRTRNVTKVPSAGGKACPDLIDAKNCAMKHCATDCILGDWEPWSTCSATCYGLQERKRKVVVQAMGGGKPCDDLHETKDCHENCRLDCKLGDWSEWSACPATCGGKGASSRTRAVIQQVANGGEACGPLSDVRQCSCIECPNAPAPKAPAHSDGFPQEGSTEYKELKMACASVVKDDVHLREVFEEHGSLHATIEWCLESVGPEGFPHDGSPHLEQLKKACATEDIFKLKEVFAEAGSFEEAMAACLETFHPHEVSQENEELPANEAFQNNMEEELKKEELPENEAFQNHFPEELKKEELPENEAFQNNIGEAPSPAAE